jgi:hypothetical protein
MDEASAIAHCGELNANYFRLANPFEMGESLFDVTNFASYALCDWLMDRDLTPPSPNDDRRTWADWWRTLDEPQRHLAWPAFNKVRFCEVREREPNIAMVPYLVAWLSNENGDFTANYEGGELEFVASKSYDFQDWVEEFAVARGDVEFQYFGATFIANHRARFHDDLRFDPPPRPIHTIYTQRSDAIPWCGIEEVPARGELGERVFVLTRRSAWRLPKPAFWLDSETNTRPLQFPLAVHGKANDAHAAAWELELETRAYLNPFRYEHPSNLTSLSEPAYRAMVLQLGLELPPSGWGECVMSLIDLQPDPAWIAWYENAVCLISDEQREMIWDLLDQLRFYTVVELEYHIR